MTHDVVEQQIARGEVGELDSISVTVPRQQWLNLLRALRHDPNLQPQLGRLAWMTVSHIEFAVSEKSKSGVHRS